MADLRKYYLGDKNLPVPDSEHEYTKEQVQELVKCIDDIVYFAENYFYITTVGHGKQKLELYKPQKRVLKALVSNRFNIILASRQVGKTTLMTAYALWETCFNSDKRVLIVANKEDTAKMILRRIKMAYEQLPNWLKPGVKQWDKTEVIFENDSSVTISTTTASAARGESINCVDGSSIITLRDKASGEIFNITMKNFHDILKRDGEIIPVSLIDDDLTVE